MVATEIRRNWYDSLTDDQRVKLALANDFGENASKIYDWLQYKDGGLIVQGTTLSTDGIYYIYDDGSKELFDYSKQNKPTKPVKRIGVVMGSHSLAVNLNDYDEQPLTNNEDDTEYDGYIAEYEDAVADWGGLKNTIHICEIGTGIPLQDDEWIPSVAELYLIYLNKRSINAALALAGGSQIKGGWYWSSTETSAQYAWYLYFYGGDLYGWHAKVASSSNVRAVAAFH